jgi:hypothetical protein
MAVTVFKKGLLSNTSLKDALPTSDGSQVVDDDGQSRLD